MTMVRSTLLFAAILVFVSGLPHGADEYQQASTEINMLLQQGKDQSACADLAKTLVEEVTASVQMSNKLLTDLDDGSSCPSQGQEVVKEAQRNKDAADKEAREAETAASEASGAEVNFGAYSLSSLTEGQCGQFWENKAYKSAIAAEAAADIAKTKADAKAKAAAGVLDEATKAAADAVKACQCQVRKAYDSAWTAANKNNEANQASYTKGKHMECVLEGKAAAECVAGEAPKPKPVTLADGVPAKPCNTATRTTTPTPALQPWTQSSQCFNWPAHRGSLNGRSDFYKKSNAHYGSYVEEKQCKAICDESALQSTDPVCVAIFLNPGVNGQTCYFYDTAGMERHTYEKCGKSSAGKTRSTYISSRAPAASTPAVGL